MVDAKESVAKLIDDLLAVSQLTLYIDLEGISLSHYGSVSILQLYEPTTACRPRSLHHPRLLLRWADNAEGHPGV